MLVLKLLAFLFTGTRGSAALRFQPPLSLTHICTLSGAGIKVYARWTFPRNWSSSGAVFVSCHSHWVRLFSGWSHHGVVESPWSHQALVSTSSKLVHLSGLGWNPFFAIWRVNTFGFCWKCHTKEMPIRAGWSGSQESGEELPVRGALAAAFGPRQKIKHRGRKARTINTSKCALALSWLWFVG